MYIYIYVYDKLATGPTWGQHSRGSLLPPSTRVPLRMRMSWICHYGTDMQRNT